MTNSGIDHEVSAAVDLAADWLSNTSRKERQDRAVIPELRSRFGLTPLEACIAITEAQQRRNSA